MRSRFQLKPVGKVFSKITSGQPVLTQGKSCHPLALAGLAWPLGDTFGQKASKATDQATQEDLHAALQPQHPLPTHSQMQETPLKNPPSKHFRENTNGLIVHSVTLCPSSLEKSHFPDSPTGLNSSASPPPRLCRLLWPQVSQGMSPDLATPVFSQQGQWLKVSHGDTESHILRN